MRKRCGVCGTVQETKGGRGAWRHSVERHLAPCGRQCPLGRWAMEIEEATKKGVTFHGEGCAECAQVAKRKEAEKLSIPQQNALRLIRNRRATEVVATTYTGYFSKATARSLERLGLLEARVLQSAVSYDRYWFLTPKGEELATILRQAARERMKEG